MQHSARHGQAEKHARGCMLTHALRLPLDSAFYRSCGQRQRGAQPCLFTITHTCISSPGVDGGGCALQGAKKITYPQFMTALSLVASVKKAAPQDMVSWGFLVLRVQGCAGNVGPNCGSSITGWWPCYEHLMPCRTDRSRVACCFLTTHKPQQRPCSLPCH